MSRSGLLLVLLLLAGVARAEWPRVMALHVEGNMVTREAVIRPSVAGQATLAAALSRIGLPIR